jgi:hypothetical protein
MLVPLKFTNFIGVEPKKHIPSHIVDTAKNASVNRLPIRVSSIIAADSDSVTAAVTI